MCPDSTLKDSRSLFFCGFLTGPVREGWLWCEDTANEAGAPHSSHHSATLLTFYCRGQRNAILASLGSPNKESADNEEQGPRLEVVLFTEGGTDFPSGRRCWVAAHMCTDSSLQPLQPQPL